MILLVVTEQGEYSDYRVSLYTGTEEAVEDARALYEKAKENRFSESSYSFQKIRYIRQVDGPAIVSEIFVEDVGELICAYRQWLEDYAE